MVEATSAYALGVPLRSCHTLGLCLVAVTPQDSMLFYYKPDVVLPDDSGVIPGSTAAGYINLASQCKVSQPSKNRICLQAELRNYFFICESSEEAAAWEADISKNLAIVKKSEHVT